MNKYTNTKYAGFWIRSIASLIDFILLTLPFILIGLIFDKENIFNIESFLIFLLLGAWYHISFLYSSWNASIGKKIVGIKVLTTALKPLDFARASKRFTYSLITYGFLLSPLLLLIQEIFSFHTFWEYLVFVVGSLPILMLFVAVKKQVLHDFLAQTVVIDVDYSKTKRMQFIRGFGILFVLLTFAMFIFILYLNIFVYAKTDSYTQKFHHDDLNDSRIVFYNKVLQNYSKGFIEADTIYEIFEMDIKKDFALTCINASLREHNISHKGIRSQNFVTNARNMYAITEERIEKAKNNEQYISAHFYEYHLQDAHRIIQNMIYLNNSDNTQETCDRLLSIERMYDYFIADYIHNREEELLRYKKAFKNAQNKGHLDKNFYEKQIKQGIQWLNILYQKHPPQRKEK